MVCKTETKFQTWKSVKVGIAQGVEKTTIALLRMGIDVNEDSMRFMRMICPDSTGRSYDLVRVSCAKLGFDRFVDTETVFDRARSFGLRLCPPQVGLQLWLQHPELLDRIDTVLVGMPPIKEQIWSLGRHVSKRWLTAPFCLSSWSPGHHWVFVQAD